MNRTEQLVNRTVKISAIVPVYNEQGNIADFIKALDQQLSKISEDYEIIMIDDGSYDATFEMLTAIATRYPLHLLKFSRHFGKEAAISAGLQNCCGDTAIIIDSDFQHPVELIHAFMSAWAQGYDMAYGVLTDRKHQLWFNRMFSRSFYWLMNKLTEINIPYNAGDFRLLDRKVINALNQCKETHRFMKGLYAWVGYRTIGINYHAQSRRNGRSSWSYHKLFDLALTGITSFSSIPLRIWGFIGLLISFLSFLYMLYVIINTLVFGANVPGYATLLTAIIFLGGIQLISVGILGEYIGRIFNEVKNRPSYIIEKKVENAKKKASKI